MGITVPIITVEIALQVIGATHAYFPRIENTIANLRRKGQIEEIPRNAKTKIAAIDDPSLQIGDIG